MVRIEDKFKTRFLQEVSVAMFTYADLERFESKKYLELGYKYVIYLNMDNTNLMKEILGLETDLTVVMLLYDQIVTMPPKWRYQLNEVLGGDEEKDKSFTKGKPFNSYDTPLEAALAGLEDYLNACFKMIYNRESLL